MKWTVVVVVVLSKEVSVRLYGRPRHYSNWPATRILRAVATRQPVCACIVSNMSAV